MGQQAASPTASPDLLAAQERLECLRRQQRAERAASGLPLRTDEAGRLLDATEARPQPKEDSQELPPHLGWGSQALTVAIRAALARQARRQAEAEPAWWEQEAAPAGPAQSSEAPAAETVQSAEAPAPETDQSARTAETAAEALAAAEAPAGSADASPVDPAAATITLYPDIAVALLRRDAAAAGRIWLLLRAIDTPGSGWVSLEQAREQLTGGDSPLRVCGWRQLRNLLSEGEGTFWQQQNGRLWLRGTARVAAALEVWRLVCPPVALPVSALLGRIAVVRAHLYASFHSSRNPAQAASAAPIARATLQAITNVNRRTQRTYEKLAHVQKEHNFAVGEKATAEAAERLAWEHGHALFRLTDHNGTLGRPGETYLAWQLPNNYVGPHAQQSRGCRKRINQKLADLFAKGMTGNNRQEIEDGADSRRKRFYGNGRLAARAYNRGAGGNIYWRSSFRLQPRRRPRSACRLWHYLPARGL